MERICITIEGGLILHGDVLVCSFVGITVVSLESRFATKSFCCIMKSFHCKVVSLQVVSLHHDHNQFFVWNSLKQFRLNYKRVITSSVSETTLQICSESTSLCGETTSTVISTFDMNKVVIRLNRSLKTYVDGFFLTVPCQKCKKTVERSI